MDFLSGKRLWKIKPLPNKEFFKNMNDDVMKYVLTIPAYMLQVVCLWPVKKSMLQKLFLWTYLVNAWIMYFFNALYFFQNATNLEIMATTMPGFCSNSQIIAKGLGFFLYQNLLNKAMYIQWKHFWPCKLLDKEEFEEVSSISKYIKLFQRSFPFLSLTVTFSMVVPALLMPLNYRRLGLELLLPDFKYTTPFYELFAIWEIILFPQGIWIVLAYDLLFIAMVNNFATQFRVLKCVLESVGQNRDDFDEVSEKDQNLIIKCIKQHIILLQYCDDLNSMCTYVVFSQFFLSAMGICFSAVLFSVYPEKRLMMLGYCLIYLLQIFIYCHPGNELKFHSSNLTEGIIQSKWYLCNPKVRKSLIPIMVRSQRESILSVGHFFELDIKNCINVLKMAFSFFTLLDNMLRIKAGNVTQ